MSEPIADGLPPLPPIPPVPSVPSGPTDRLDVDATVADAIDLDSAAAEPTSAQVAPTGQPGGAEAEPLTRAQRRAQAEAASSRRGRVGGRGGGSAAATAVDSSVLDHPAVLVALSVLTLVAVVVGLDQASQGNLVALLPAVLLAAAYVVVVRRRRSRR